MGINYNKRKEKIMQKQFCLATEPWIKAIDLQGEVRELSLKSTFAQAHEIRCLAGGTAKPGLCCPAISVSRITDGDVPV